MRELVRVRDKGQVKAVAPAVALAADQTAVLAQALALATALSLVAGLAVLMTGLGREPDKNRVRALAQLAGRVLVKVRVLEQMACRLDMVMGPLAVGVIQITARRNCHQTSRLNRGLPKLHKNNRKHRLRLGNLTTLAGLILATSLLTTAANMVDCPAQVVKIWANLALLPITSKLELAQTPALATLGLLNSGATKSLARLAKIRHPRRPALG